MQLTKSINAFLTESKDNKFHIPIYQRKYTWDKYKIEDLFNDLDDVNLSDTESYHFFGLIVYVDNLNKKSHFDVIDGQQRLTTIFIVLNCILDIIYYITDKHSDFLKPTNPKSKEINTAIHEIRSILYDVNSDRKISSLNEDPYEDNILKMLTSELDIYSPKWTQKEVSIIKKSLFNAREELVETLKIDKRKLKGKRNFDAHKYCKEYFVNECLGITAKTWRTDIAKIDESQAKKGLENLVKFQNKLCHRLKIIPFKPNSNLEAFKLFEVLNDRGLAVSGIDLFKNNCLQRAINDPQTKDIHDKWQDVFENTLITQNPSIFLRTSYNSRNDFVTKNNLFQNFSSLIKNKDYTETIDYLEGHLLTDAQVYNWATLDSPKTDPDYSKINNLLNILKSTKATQYLTITISSLRVLEISSAKKTIEYVENVIENVVEIIISLIFNNERFNLIEKKLPSIAKGIKSYTNDKTSQQVLEVADKKLIDFKKQNLKSNYKSIILNELDLTKNSNINLLIQLIKFENGDTISHMHTVEHICPQKIDSGSIWEKAFPVTVRDKFIYNLGNVVSIGKKLNTSVSNKNFKEKKKEYQKQKINDHISDPKLKIIKQSSWNQKIIKERDKSIRSILKTKFKIS